MSTDIPSTKPCPVCGETILLVAKKCKHCGEFLEIAHLEPDAEVEATGPKARLTLTNQAKQLTAGEKATVCAMALVAAFIFYATSNSKPAEAPIRAGQQAGARARTLPACSPATYEATVSAFAKTLPPKEKSRLLDALTRIDTWFTMNGKSNGLKMSDSDVYGFMANFCGKSVDEIERRAKLAMPD